MKSFLLAFFLFTLSLCMRAQDPCASPAYLQQEIRKNPALANRLATAGPGLTSEILSGTIEGNGNTTMPVIRVPVVVHVIYRTDEQNISDAQILSQIQVLNQAFRLANPDTVHIPAPFKSLAADCRIEFVMASVTPKGYMTNGIVRKKTSVYSFFYDDKIKFSSSGGDDAWDSDRYLNIWVGNLTSGLNGYSSVLGNDPSKDGIVVRFDGFGNQGKLTYPFIKGHTAVHEAGHWLGLKHIWGDQFCGNDGIDDTPTQNGPTRGCPAQLVSSCSNTSIPAMYNNYMDVTNDECTNMFSIGQRQKMRECFQQGGPRFRLASSDAATAIGLPEPNPIPGAKETASFQFFPNPAVNSVTVSFNNDEAKAGRIVSIYNHLGQQVMQVLVTRNNFTINLHSLKDGVYYLKTSDQSKASKLIKTSSASL